MKILTSEDHLPTRPPSLAIPVDKPPSITIEGCDDEDNNMNGADKTKEKKKKKKGVAKKGEEKKEKEKKDDTNDDFDGDAMLAAFRRSQGSRGRSPMRRLSTMY